MPILAAGRLQAVSNVIYEARANQRVTVTFSDDAGGASAVNCHMKSPTTGKFRRIGKSTVIATNTRLEIPGDGSSIAMGPGDQIFGDAPSGTVDFVVSGD